MMMQEILKSVTCNQSESLKKALITRLNSIGVSCDESNILYYAKKIEQATTEGTQNISFYFYPEDGEKVLLFKMIIDNEIIIDGYNVKMITKISYE